MDHEVELANKLKQAGVISLILNLIEQDFK